MGNKSSNKNINKKKIIYKQYNICVCGSPKVGKTSFIKQIFENFKNNTTGNSFSVSYEVTNNNGSVDIINTTFVVTENNDYNGNINFINNINKDQYYKNNLEKYNMLILIYDISNPSSFDYIHSYLDKMYNFTRNNWLNNYPKEQINNWLNNYPKEQINNILNKKILIVGNKLDIIEEIRELVMSAGDLDYLIKKLEKEKIPNNELINKIKINKYKHQFIMREIGMNLMRHEFDSEFVEVSSTAKNFDKNIIIEKIVDLLSRQVDNLQKCFR